MNSLFRMAAALGALAVASCASLPGASAEADRPTAARIAGIALVANNVEAMYATLAADRSSDADVRSYAARMRTDHGSLAASLAALLASLDIEAADDPAASALRDASVARRQRLDALTGRAFDVAYVDIDMESHRELLDVIDRVLLPAASRTRLQEYVGALRPVVSAHMAHAEQLRATLDARGR